MSYLVEILKEAGFQNVQTYIQSGNILLETNLSFSKTAALIHNIILEKIVATTRKLNVIKHLYDML